MPAPIRAFLRDWEAASGELGTVATVAALEAIGIPLYDLVVRGDVSFDASILVWILGVIAALAR